MRRLIILAQAEAEMLEAAGFYGRQQAELAVRFLAAVQDAFTKIRVKPSLYPLLEVGVRRCVVRIFPFAIIFRVEDEAIVVVSVMHLSRDPEHWKQRH